MILRHKESGQVIDTDDKKYKGGYTKVFDNEKGKSFYKIPAEFSELKDFESVYSSDFRITNMVDLEMIEEIRKRNDEVNSLKETLKSLKEIILEMNREIELKDNKIAEERKRNDLKIKLADEFIRNGLYTCNQSDKLFFSRCLSDIGASIKIELIQEDNK